MLRGFMVYLLSGGVRDGCKRTLPLSGGYPKGATVVGESQDHSVSALMASQLSRDLMAVRSERAGP